MASFRCCARQPSLPLPVTFLNDSMCFLMHSSSVCNAGGKGPSGIIGFGPRGCLFLIFDNVFSFHAAVPSDSRALIASPNRPFSHILTARLMFPASKLSSIHILCLLLSTSNNLCNNVRFPKSEISQSFRFSTTKFDVLFLALLFDPD